MNSKTAIFNATPLISLAILGRLDLLDKLFSLVVVPESVAKEVTTPDKPFSEELARFVKDKIRACRNKDLVQLFAFNLDAGESEVLALYYEIENAIVVVDEEKARKLALRKEIPFIGTLGLLVLAKRNGLIPEVKSLLDLLIEREIRIGKKVYKKVLSMAGED